MNVWAISDIGLVRQQNQDAFRVEKLPSGQILLVVCDGMGGARAGNVASNVAANVFGDTVLAHLADTEYQDTVSAVMMDAVKQANRAVWEQANGDANCFGMGTTLVAALVTEQACCIANVGDSRAYLINADGIRKVTRDHSVVEDLVLRGEITPEQARTHPQKNLITRALGTMEETKADIYEEPCLAGSFLLLCSDGLSNVVADQEILYEVIHGGEPENCCNRLLNTALQRGAPDNVTAVLLQM